MKISLSVAQDVPEIDLLYCRDIVYNSPNRFNTCLFLEECSSIVLCECQTKTRALITVHVYMYCVNIHSVKKTKSLWPCLFYLPFFSPILRVYFKWKESTGRIFPYWYSLCVCWLLLGLRHLVIFFFLPLSCYFELIKIFYAGMHLTVTLIILSVSIFLLHFSHVVFLHQKPAMCLENTVC